SFMLLATYPSAALNPSLDISQYAHTAWKSRDGFGKGSINAIAQTPDGYLWLGTEFGLLRFDGVRLMSWKPPQGKQLPANQISSLLVSRDGTLWIGTYKGLASWKDEKLTTYSGLEEGILSLIQDHVGTIWVGTVKLPSGAKLCTVGNDG